MKNKSKITFLILFIMMMTKSLFAQTGSGPDAILGNFKSPDGDRTMEIYKDKEEYFGKLTSFSGTDGTLKIGTVLLKNFSYTKGKWEGKVFIPAKNTDFDATLVLEDHNKLVIKVKAGIMSKSKTWSRVQ